MYIIGICNDEKSTCAEFENMIFEEPDNVNLNFLLSAFHRYQVGRIQIKFMYSGILMEYIHL